MQRDAVTCPSCSTQVSLAPIHASSDGESRISTGTVLKKCPSCRKWAWMNPVAQGAT